MKGKLSKIGWTGWAIVGLVVVLVVGAIIAANTQGPESEDSGREDDLSGAIDASDKEVISVSGGRGEEEAPVVNGGLVSEAIPAVEALPETGVMGEEEFIYYLD